MSKAIYDDLWREANRRSNETVKTNQNRMANLYRGKLPDEYEQYFPVGQPKNIIQLVKNAWNDLSSEVGRAPELVSPPLDESRTESKLAGLHERIGYYYLRNAEPTGKQFAWQLAWWLVGTGMAVGMVKPDMDKKMPVLTIRDPRTALPNLRTVGNVPVEIYDILFNYEIPYNTAVEMGLAEKRRMPQGGPYEGDAIKVKVLEFIDDQYHTLVSEQGMMMREEHGLGKVPAWVFQSFSPEEKDAGLSLFKDQVSLMVAVSMLITYKLAAADRNVNPIYWAKGHQGVIKIGPNVLNKLSTQGEIGRLDPPLIPQVDRDIQMLVSFSNILNKNPEVRQGQVDAKGAYVSAKTLQEMAESIDTTLDQYWDIQGPGMQHLLGLCYQMDEKLWPNEEKRITTNVKGKRYRDVYTPKADINGRYYVNIDYGFGLGGYQGFLMNLQANQAKVRSRKATVEQMPGVSDVDQELNQIDLEDLHDAQKINIQSQAAAGQMDALFLADVIKRVEKGDSLNEALLKLTEEAQQQAQQAVESGATAPVTTPPAEEGAPEQAPAPPGLNPAALV